MRSLFDTVCLMMCCLLHPCAAYCLLSRCLSNEQLAAGLLALAGPLLQPLTNAMHQFTPSLGAGQTATAVQLPLFDRLTILFQSMRQQQAAAEVLRKAWGAIDTALQRAAGDSTAVEQLCRYGW